MASTSGAHPPVRRERGTALRTGPEQEGARLRLCLLEAKGGTACACVLSCLAPDLHGGVGGL